MPEMQKAISRLRLVLASIKAKERELDSLIRQFRRQLDRARIHGIHGNNSLNATLSIMEEVQERLDNVEMKRSHLAAIKERAKDELAALELTNKIERAKSDLASLKGRQSSGGALEEAEQERIEGLERFIETASIRAGEAITGRLDPGENSAGSGLRLP